MNPEFMTVKRFSNSSNGSKMYAAFTFGAPANTISVDRTVFADPTNKPQRKHVAKLHRQQLIKFYGPGTRKLNLPSKSIGAKIVNVF